MTVKSRKEMLTKVFEHFCNNEAETANELLHQYIVESARAIHSEMIANEEAIQEEALETDMEADLAKDLHDIHGEGEGENMEHGDHADAEEDLAKDMLGDDDMEASDEESFEEEPGEEEVEDELHHHEETDAEHEEEITDRVEDLESEFEELKKAFDDLAGEEGEKVEESTDLMAVGSEGGGKDIIGKKKVGEVGSGSSGMGIDANAKSPFSGAKNDVKLGGEPVAIGKGPTHKGFERETAPTSKEMGKFKNRVKSGTEVLTKVGSEKYNTNPKGEVGSGKSGIPVEHNTKSVL